jgi:Mrp family chromosome partitioning ATPase/capsular polysaccharide biosynthesis protein
MNSYREESKPTWLAPQGPREGLRHYVEVISERRRMIVLCVVLTTIIAGVYATLAPRTWEAESRLLISPVNGATNLIGLGLLTSSSNPGGDISTAASLVTTPEVAALVAARVGHTTARAMLTQASAVPVAQSNVVAVIATASSAVGAQAIANAFALATIENRTQSLHRQLDAIIPALRSQVQALPPIQRTGQGSLGERLASLETLRAGPDPTVAVAALAQLPTVPSWPRKKLSIVAGILVGLIVGLGGAFALEGLDPRVRREESLRRIFRLPVLARIPRERRRSWRGPPLRPVDLSPAAHESYRMLRVALGARGGGRAPSRSMLLTDSRSDETAVTIIDVGSLDPRSIMITGSTSSEGKSTVALNLAAVLASAGSKVILIEADVHRPSLGAALGVRAKRGITGVLMGKVELEDALIKVEGLGDGNLSVLLAEESAFQLPDGLLGGADEFVERAEAIADYVVLDAPPVTEVSDALPLSKHVHDVLIVARLGHTRRDQLVNLGEVLTRQGVRPAGLVVVGDDLGQGSGYHGSYAQSPAPSGGLRRRLGKLIPKALDEQVPTTGG